MGVTVRAAGLIARQGEEQSSKVLACEGGGQLRLLSARAAEFK